MDKNLFSDLPSYIQDLVNEITDKPLKAKSGINLSRTGKEKFVRDKGKWKLATEEDIKLLELAEKLIAEEKLLYPKQESIKISRAELERWEESEERKEKERLELITVPSEPIYEEEFEEPFEEKLNKLIPKVKKDGIWDFGIEDLIPFFDIGLSYELSGYRPINETEGLDFDPEWYIQARRNKEKTGRYTNAPKGTKAYDDFWLEEYDRLNNGLEINGYRITGDHYYFLNYYLLMSTGKVLYAGQGRSESFADFYVAQYEYFHYVELCKRLRKNCLGLKGRGVG